MNLKNKGLGSYHIAKILGISRNAIEGWINQGRKPYHFSEKRIAAQTSLENIERMRKMNKITQPKACRISAEMRTKRLPESAKKISKELAYILGVCYGDGHISVKQRRIILGVTDQEFAEEFKRVLEKWSGFKARLYERKPRKCAYIKINKKQYVVYIDSKEVSNFLKKFNSSLFKKANKKAKSAFLKGLFDSDGGVRKSKFGLYFHNTNYGLILLVKELLESVGINPTSSTSKTTKIGPYGGKKILRFDYI